MSANNTAKTSRDSWLVPVLRSLVAEHQVDALLDGEPKSLWLAAVEGELVSDQKLLDAVAKAFSIKAVRLEHTPPHARELIPESLARRYGIVPVDGGDGWLEIATSSPNDLDCERAVGFATGRRVRTVLASPAAIAIRLDELYRPENVVERILQNVTENYQVESLVEEAESTTLDIAGDGSSERPIMRLVDYILAEGISSRASDIHIETEEAEVAVRYRVDGLLKQVMTLPRTVGVPLVSRIKIMSGMDIADRLRPQDGRARVAINGVPVDLRVSSLPATHGEKVVVRVLDQRAMIVSLERMGLAPDEAERLKTLLEIREGFVLVTGPTGSGKTTSLYSMLRRVQERGLNIITVEDPVEYRIQGIVQVQVNEKAGLNFASALRSILRQDPDVVLVGEIRDRETATIALQAALTGHLVLSTLHTIDAASALTRLRDIGVDSYKIAAAVKGIVAQRLVRRICSNCRRPSKDPVPARLRRWISPDAVLYHGSGCAECGETGYRGRLAVMEIVVMNRDLERMMADSEPSARIAAAARGQGMGSLWDSAIGHVLAGRTSVEEVLRVLDVPIEEPPPRAQAVPVEIAPVHPAPPPVPERKVAEPPPASNVAMISVGEGAFELIDDELATNPPRKSGALRVLLVDDEEPLRRSLREVLSDDGFEVFEAVDGADALEQVDRHTPDVIVLDLVLPQVDGYEVLRRLRSRPATQSIRVIVLTSHGDEESEVRVFGAGADDFLAKPFRPRALSARIRSLAGRP